MPLPRLIEYLESIQREGGGFLAEHENFQLVIQAVPPGITVTAQILPPTGMYGMICFRLSFGVGMVPNAFQGTVHHAGRNHYSGLVTATLQERGLDVFIMVTDALPIRYQELNNTALNQYFEIEGQFITIPSETDYELIRQHLGGLLTERVCPPVGGTT